ncbi:hypothetical protein KIPB_011163, partial [Kipferlia bialata]
VVVTSQQSVRQRAGRAGRERPGDVYHLYTYNSFMEELPVSSTPEMQRVDLSGTYLTLLACGIAQPFKLRLLSPPSVASQRHSLRTLIEVGAIRNTMSSVTKAEYAAGARPEPELRLTPMGRRLVSFPLDPRLSRSLVAAHQLNCLAMTLSIAALLSVGPVFVTPPTSERDDAQAQWKRFVLTEDGDHGALLRVYKQWLGETRKSRRDWCKRMFVSNRSLEGADRVRNQLAGIVEGHNMMPRCLSGEERDYGWDTDTQLVLQAMCTGYKANIARKTDDGRTYRTARGNQTAVIHPSSCVTDQPAVVIYQEFVHTTRTYLRCVAPVKQQWIV